MYSILIRVIAALTALTTNVVLARMLGVHQYGHYMTLYSAAVILGSVAVLGTDQLLTREFSAGITAISSSRTTLVRWVIRRLTLGITLCIALFLAWSSFTDTAPLLKQWPLSSACIILISLFATCMLLSGALNGHGASQRSQLLTPLINNGTVLAFALLTSILYPTYIKDVSVIWFQVLGYFLASVLGVYWLHTTRAVTLIDTSSLSRPTRNAERHAEWSIASNHFLVVAITATAVNRLDVVLVSMIRGNTTAGIYVAGARLAQAALLIAVAVNTVLSPRLSAAWAKGNRSELARLVRRGAAFTTVVSVLEVILALLCSSAVTHILGQPYHASANVFLSVVIAYALWTLAAPYFALLNMTGSEKSLALLSASVAAINITAMFILVPAYGAIGAGLSMIVGYAAILPIVAILVSKKLRSNHLA